jgi:hypothetical protein
MTEFTQEVRHMCRTREAFCTRGCYGSFYLKRCVVCEGPIERKAANQKVCKKNKCRNAWKPDLASDATRHQTTPS